MAILSYFGILCLIPIFAAKDDPFVQFHANQGLVLFICELVVSILARVLSRVTVLAIILGLVDLVLLVFMIMGIINAAKKEEKPLPLIGGIQILK